MILNRLFVQGARIVEDNLLNKGTTNEVVIAHEIEAFFASPEYKAMRDGERYYEGRHDIAHKKREMMDGSKNPDGSPRMVELHYLPNSRVADNQYKKMVKQKTNYLVGKPITVDTENEQLEEILTKDIFNRKFAKTLKRVTKRALNCGIAWIYCNYNDRGEFELKSFKTTELVPLWKDADHTELEGMIRVYDVVLYDGKKEETIWKVEFYTEEGIEYYEYVNGRAVKTEPYFKPYFETAEGDGRAWERIPFVPFKYNDEEIPLIVNCKSLQDGLNTILSNFQDNMVEDMRSTIMVLLNYEGTSLSEFRRNLLSTGIIPVRSVEGATGGVQTLSIEVNAANYQLVLQLFKKAIVENCMGYDAKDEKYAGTANQMNILSMYNDIDLDAKDMETEFQDSLQDLMFFVFAHLNNAGQGDYFNEKVDFIFDTDMPMDESATIANLKNSVGILSNETIVSMHPYVKDVKAELDRIKSEQQEALDMQDVYKDAFGGSGEKGSEGDEVDG